MPIGPITPIQNTSAQNTSATPLPAATSTGIGAITPIQYDNSGQMQTPGGMFGNITSQPAQQPGDALQGQLQQLMSKMPDEGSPLATQGPSPTSSAPVTGSTSMGGIPVPNAAIDTIGRVGRAVYNDPLIHLIAAPLANAANKLGLGPSAADVDKLYSTLGTSSSIREHIADGIGQVIPMLTGTGIAGKAIEGASALTKGVQGAKYLTGFLRDNDIAKLATSGGMWDAAEYKTANPNASAEDIATHAMGTAAQFAMLGAASKFVGEPIGGFLGKFFGNTVSAGEKANAARILDTTPAAGFAIGASMNNTTKSIFTPNVMGRIGARIIDPLIRTTPEQWGRLAGRVGTGAAQGALGAADAPSGVAGAIVGGAMSAYNPMEQNGFAEGLGSNIHPAILNKFTSQWGEPFENANNIIKEYGADKVEDIGSNENTVPQVQGYATNTVKNLLTELQNTRDWTVGVADNVQRPGRDADDAAFLNTMKGIVGKTGAGDPLAQSPLRDSFNNLLKQKAFGNLPVSDGFVKAVGLPEGISRISIPDAKALMQRLDPQSKEAAYLDNLLKKDPYNSGKISDPQQLSYRVLANYSRQLRTMPGLNYEDSGIKDQLVKAIDNHINKNTPGNVAMYRGSGNGAVPDEALISNYNAASSNIQRLKDIFESPVASGGIGAPHGSLEKSAMGDRASSDAIKDALIKSHLTDDPSAMRIFQRHMQEAETIINNTRQLNADGTMGQSPNQLKQPTDFYKKMRCYNAWRIYDNPTEESMNKIRVTRDAFRVMAGGAAVLAPGLEMKGMSAAAAWFLDHFSQPRNMFKVWKGSTMAKNKVANAPNLQAWAKMEASLFGKKQ